MRINILLIIQNSETTTANWLSSPGVIGTIVLVFIIIFLGAFILIKRINKYVDKLEENNQSLSDEEFERRLVNLDKHEVDEILKLRQQGFKRRAKRVGIYKSLYKI